MFRHTASASILISLSSHSAVAAKARSRAMSPDRLMQQIVDDWLVVEASRVTKLDTFFADMTTPDSLAVTTAEDLYAAYTGWCAVVGVPPESRNTLGRVLRATGFTPRRAAGGRRVWAGLRLQGEAASSSEGVSALKAREIHATNAATRFLASSCVFSPPSVTKSGTLYAAWKAYAREVGEPPLSHRAFSLAVKAAGVEGRRVRGQRSWIGIALRTDGAGG